MEYRKDSFENVILLSLVLFLSFSACAPEEGVAAIPSRGTPSPVAVSTEKEAWEVEWQQAIAGARKEGKVSIYSTSGGELRSALVTPLKSKLGLALEWTSGIGAQVSQKLFSERRAGIYVADVYLGGNTTIINEFKPAQVLDPPGPVLLLPEVLDLKAWWGGRGPVYLDADKMVLPVSIYPSGDIVINTDLVKEGEVVSYRDMLDPKWKGKVVIFDPTVAGAGLGWFTFVAFELDDLDFFRELVKNKPAIVRDHRQLTEWLAQGKFAIALGTKPEVVTAFREAGAHLKAMYPKEGGYVSSGGGNAALINRAPHPRAAQVFLNWILSREGGTLYSQTMGVQSGRLDVPTDHLNPMQVRQEGVKYANHMREDFLKLRPQHAKIAQEIFGPLLK